MIDPCGRPQLLEASRLRLRPPQLQPPPTRRRAKCPEPSDIDVGVGVDDDDDAYDDDDDDEGEDEGEGDVKCEMFSRRSETTQWRVMIQPLIGHHLSTRNEHLLAHYFYVTDIFSFSFSFSFSRTQSVALCRANLKAQTRQRARNDSIVKRSNGQTVRRTVVTVILSNVRLDLSMMQFLTFDSLVLSRSLSVSVCVCVGRLMNKRCSIISKPLATPIASVGSVASVDDSVDDSVYRRSIERENKCFGLA